MIIALKFLIAFLIMSVIAFVFFIIAMVLMIKFNIHIIGTEQMTKDGKAFRKASIDFLNVVTESSFGKNLNKFGDCLIKILHREKIK